MTSAPALRAPAAAEMPAIPAPITITFAIALVSFLNQIGSWKNLLINCKYHVLDKQFDVKYDLFLYGINKKAGEHGNQLL
jgi:hypothetical protein